MAKVYSWQVSERAFAYIVDPNDTSIPRIGSEITNEKDIQTISDWAQNATDTQYDAQFEKMVAKCHAMGYNVEFETPVAYRTVATTCDNLRGPAGRGIQKIEYSHPAPNGEGSVYYIYYDDGWSDSIIIKDGKDGRDGVDGKPGAPGDSGVSSKLIMILLMVFSFALMVGHVMMAMMVHLPLLSGNQPEHLLQQKLQRIIDGVPLFRLLVKVEHQVLTVLQLNLFIAFH